MSANLVVSLNSDTDHRTSINVGSGSNLVVGQIVDFLYANTYCQVEVAGNGVAGGSGAIHVWIQTSDSTASGSFTDPTSGLAQLPLNVQSGGAFFANSGLWSSGSSSLTSVVDNAPLFCSGGFQFTEFQRPHRYARLILNSGFFPGPITAGFISNKKTTGSGGGFTFAPGSGTVNV